ncbi:phenylacetic acid degradation protein PaaN [Catenulispora sp. NF23]|uniref:phenylacetic acid degradation protein PaaN n=1 Tax=Catenulispora pinistramenti TaxID=2705254 RepID=UPI001BAA96D5|nr:phenylacetic acid degradation protein PaaN [Catenulispora pinistramenti]MBS2536902.1 phenylacetic acid degradation protein PaaN [Catenulispora pinistramenti]
MTATAEQFTVRHRETLGRAVEAIRERAFWTPYPEIPKAYGEEAGPAGKAAYEGYLNRPFPLAQPGTDELVGGEKSPYGVALGVTYPHPDLDVLLPAMQRAMPKWRDAGPEARATVLIEALARLNARTHEIAHAVHHTSGQAFGMAFQAGGPHAQDRGLEAVAYAYAAQTAQVAAAEWEKPQGPKPSLHMTKKFTAVPRGIGLVIGCNTFPTWNSYPGLFASLATGNAVVVKPHPNAILPLAISVAVLRDTLAEAGFDPDLVALAVEKPGEGLAKTLATRPEIRVIDYTGSTEFGVWLERNAPQAVVYTEKAGINTVIVDSVEDYKGMLGNLAFSFSLYSGQMCTTPQNIFVPREGITAGGEHKSFDDFATDLATAVDKLLGDDARANALLGAVCNPGVTDRLKQAESVGKTILASRTVKNTEYPDAEVRTPLIAAIDSTDTDVYTGEWFGPISFLIAADTTDQAIDTFRKTVRDHGAITASVYSTDDDVIAKTEDAALDAGVNLSVNLTGGVYVNQSAAFSDFHATGANPAANAALSDLAYVASRFRVVQSRRHI